MKNSSSLLFVILIAISVSFVSAQSEQLFAVIKTQNVFYDDEVPKITGKILDQSKKPVSDAQVQVQFASETVETKTKTDGSFSMSSTIPVTIGQYGASIIVSKPGYAMGVIPIEYSIIKKSMEKTATAANTTKTLGGDSRVVGGLVNNPITQILAKQMEIMQKQQPPLLNQTAKQNDTLSQQRKMVKESIEQDIARMNKDVEYYNPFNAFSRFVEDFDSSIKNVFWAEFEITQKQHAEGQKAKIAALEHSHSYKEATKAYQEMAQISKDKIIRLNDDINKKFKAVNQTSNLNQNPQLTSD